MENMASGIARGEGEGDDVGVAQQVDKDTQPGFIVSFFDIGQPCCSQLTPVRYLLTSNT